MTAAEAVHEAMTLVAEAVRKLDRAKAILDRAELTHTAKATEAAANQACEVVVRLSTIEADLPYRMKVIREDIGHPDDKEQK